MNHEQALAALLRRPAAVVTDADLLATACTDWRGWFPGTALALVRPASVVEVCDVMRYCAAHGLTVVPQGGNSSLVGGSVPPTDGRAGTIVLSLGGLNRIRAVDPRSWSLVAEAGCTLDAIQGAAAAADRAIGLDLGARGTAQLGGLIATNAGGMGVVRYGTMRDQVLGIEAVLPNGEVWNGLRCLRKDNSGYDLKQLLIGSEGTLGIVTAAALRLHPPERHSVTVLLALRDAAAINPVADRLLESNSLSALEFMPAFGIRIACECVVNCSVPIALESEWFIQARFAGPNPLEAAAEDVAGSLLEEGLVVDAVVATSIAQERLLWEIRDSFSPVHRHLGHSFRFDLSVPLGGIPELLSELGAAVDRVVPGACVFAFGHLGDGNVHYSVCQPPDGDEAAFRAHGEAIEEAVNEICWAAGGSISAEHGIGRLHRADLLRQKPVIELELQRRIKNAFDPRGLLNPEVLFPPQAAGPARSIPDQKWR